MINWFDMLMFLLLIFAFCVGIILLILLFDFVVKKITKSEQKTDVKKDNTSTKQNCDKNQK